MADNNLFIVYQRIATLLRAEPTFLGDSAPAALRPANFITYDGTNPNPDKQTRTDRDYPEVIFDISSTQIWRDFGFNAPSPVTFCTTSGGTTGNSTQRNAVYEFIITSKDMRFEPIMAVITAIETTLIKGGPRLGIPDIVLIWGPTMGTWTKTAGDSGAGTYRRVCRINVPVQFLLPNSTITG